MAIAAKGADTPGSERPQLLMAVPKRLLKRAVDRNAVKRVAREHWRHLRWQHGGGGVRAQRYLLRLKARPVGYAESSRPARKKFWHLELSALFARLSA